ncbi:MAG: flagellar protein FlgN [Candidatus Binatia bacterium]|nr:flagellar protein FlgN [Candidatus Binatia bacterium]
MERVSDGMTEEPTGGIPIHALRDLVAVMEEEVQVGEELLHNLEAQRVAILSWDASTLLLRVEEREAMLRRLSALEERRQRIVLDLPCLSPNHGPSLRTLLARLPEGPETVSLRRLQRQILELYGRLRAAEQRVVALMDNLLGHLREALTCFCYSPVYLYGKKGAMTYGRPASGLIQGKA